MLVEIVTIEGIKFSSDGIKYVSLNLPDGGIGIMNGFECSRLRLLEGKIRIDDKRFHVSSGFAQIDWDKELKRSLISIIVLSAKELP